MEVCSRRGNSMVGGVSFFALGVNWLVVSRLRHPGFFFFFFVLSVHLSCSFHTFGEERSIAVKGSPGFDLDRSLCSFLRILLI